MPFAMYTHQKLTDDEFKPYNQIKNGYFTSKACPIHIQDPAKKHLMRIYTRILHANGDGREWDGVKKKRWKKLSAQQNNGFTSRWSGKLIPRIPYTAFCTYTTHKPYEYFFFLYRFAFSLTKKILHDSPRVIFSLFSFHFSLFFHNFFFSSYFCSMFMAMNGCNARARFQKKKKNEEENANDCR